MSHKRIGLLLASEETYPGATLGIIHQIQEFARYTHGEFVGVVRGVGNSRSDIARDPADPTAGRRTHGPRAVRSQVLRLPPGHPKKRPRLARPGRLIALPRKRG